MKQVLVFTGFVKPNGNVEQHKQKCLEELIKVGHKKEELEIIICPHIIKVKENKKVFMGTKIYFYKNI